ncbi:MAG: bifunctional precorrin-2 dehydrogenase/sirohydrochlorin ferrochelatase [Halanaerobium sp.]
MNFYPINLNLQDKKVLIVGAGRVALRKFKRLLPAEAEIKVVSPEFNQGFESYLKEKSEQYNFFKREFEEKDLIGQFLVFAATDNPKLNQRIALLARGKNILVNIIDDAELSDFTVPAAVNRGELLLTASSGSNLPALSKNIKEKLEQEFGLEYPILLEIMQARRAQIIAEIDEISERREIFRKLASDQFLERIREIINQSNLDLKNDKETGKWINEKLNLNEVEVKQIYRKVETEIDKIIAELRDD